MLMLLLLLLLENPLLMSLEGNVVLLETLLPERTLLSSFQMLLLLLPHFIQCMWVSDNADKLPSKSHLVPSPSTSTNLFGPLFLSLTLLLSFSFSLYPSFSFYLSFSSIPSHFISLVASLSRYFVFLSICPLFLTFGLYLSTLHYLFLHLFLSLFLSLFPFILFSYHLFLALSHSLSLTQYHLSPSPFSPSSISFIALPLSHFVRYLTLL